MPDLQNIELIQRDLSKRSEKIRRAKERYLVQLEEIGVSEEEADLLLGSGDGPKKL
jgi:metal-responsive CopG/Arc/MetJ family transcriptional regulator